jgi:triphosphatase
MELTLRLSQSDVAKLYRLPLVKAARGGRTRSQAVRIVWHDSLDRALAARGLALAEHRGTWRLERHRPERTEPWPPATDHRVIEEATEPASLHHSLPETLIPIAAFEGRRTVVPLTVDGEAVTLTVLDGVLRAVAAERPATRLMLEGPSPKVRTLALAVAETLPLSVPRQSLAAEALSLADGTRPVPRRQGAPELSPDEISVTAAFAHIIGHLTDVLLHLAPLAADPATGVEPVHQIRVAVRRARSAFSLFPPVSGDPSGPIAAEGLKQLSQILGPARDWDVFMTETTPPVEAVLPDHASLHAWLRAGERRRRAARAALAAYLTGAEFRLLTLELCCLAASEPVMTRPFAAETVVVEAVPPRLPDFAATVLRARWRKLAHVGKRLEDLDNPGLHNLRLKAKRLRYAAEFFAPLFAEKPGARFIRRLAALQERLGVFNDTAAAEVLSRELGGNPGFAAGLVLGFTAARGAGIRPKIVRAWARFRRVDPFWE